MHNRLGSSNAYKISRYYIELLIKTRTITISIRRINVDKRLNDY